MKARMGPVAAITATAHKMARTIYNMMLKKTDFEDAGGDFYDKQNEEKALRYLRKRAATLGYTLEKGNSKQLESSNIEQVTWSNR
jgi:hypothetical protein